MGGDEFCILFLDKGDEEVRAICQSLQSAFYAASAHTEYSNVRVSIGIARAQEGDEGNDLLSRADRALYRAKRDKGSICVDDGMEGMGAHDPGRAVLEAEAKSR